MGDALAVQLIIVTIAARRTNAVAVDINDRLYGILLIGRFLDRHAPRFIAGIHPPTDQRAPYRHQIAGDPLFGHQRGQVIGGIAFANGRKINKQVGDILFQILLAVLVQHRQMV